MNKLEAKRYAHAVAAEQIRQYLETVPPSDEPLAKSPDWPGLAKALRAIAEQHQRYGPKIADAKPRPAPRRRETPLFDERDPTQQNLTD